MMKNSYLILIVASIFLVGCGKYRKYDNMEVVESSFTGPVTITSSGTNPAGDFEGNGDSGTYSFAYDNPKKKAQVNFDVTAPAGSVQMVIKDAKGNEVLNETRNGGGNDTFAGTTSEGKKGIWLVEIILNNVDGDGSFSINPVD